MCLPSGTHRKLCAPCWSPSPLGTLGSAAIRTLMRMSPGCSARSGNRRPRRGEARSAAMQRASEPAPATYNFDAGPRNCNRQYVQQVLHAFSFTTRLRALPVRTTCLPFLRRVDLWHAQLLFAAKVMVPLLNPREACRRNATPESSAHCSGRA